jgi:hypothetical protein
MQDAGCRMQDAGCKMPDITYEKPDTCISSFIGNIFLWEDPDAINFL